LSSQFKYRLEINKYTYSNKFTDKLNTLAAIYIVRDPRNLITSLSYHYELSLDEAFNFLTNKRKIICN